MELLEESIFSGGTRSSRDNYSYGYNGSKNRAKKDMQWGPASSDEQEEVRSYKPSVCRVWESTRTRNLVKPFSIHVRGPIATIEQSAIHCRH